MRSLSTDDFLNIWERGFHLHPLDRGLLTLSAALPETSYDSLADWPLGQRNRALAELRCACFGPGLQGWIRCAQCEEKLEELYQDLMAELAQKETNRAVTGIFVKLKFHDFTRTTADRAGLDPSLQSYRSLLAEAFSRTEKNVRLIGVGVRFAEPEEAPAQLSFF